MRKYRHKRHSREGGNLNQHNMGSRLRGNDAITLHALLNAATTQLHASGIEAPQLDARLLLSHATQLSRTQLVSQAHLALTPEAMALFQSYIHRRLHHEPVARIIGTKEFWGLEFQLSPATLVPRPDSETLIEAALTLYPDKTTPLKILDIGTGTGCLALALLHEYKNAHAVALDISQEALNTATQNAANLKLDSRIDFRLSNLTSALSDDEQFDLIISNPPYIPSVDILTLSPEVQQFDPHLALDGGDNGLDIYHKIIPTLYNHLMPEDVLLLEFGISQNSAIYKMLEYANYKNIKTYKDIAGIIRAISATKI